jgi:hypothetical protein
MTPQAFPLSKRLAMTAQSQSPSSGKSALGRCSSGGVEMGSRSSPRYTCRGKVLTLSLKSRTQPHTVDSRSAVSTVTASPAAVGRASSASSCSRVSASRLATRDQTQRSHQDTAQVRMPVSTTNAEGCASCTSARR